MIASTEVQVRIVSIIRDHLAVRHVQIQPSDRLVKDLKIASDDLSFLFAPEVERSFGIKIAQEEWANVYTVADAVNLVQKRLVELGAGER